MKILQVVHGYPPLNNAGSEIYTQTVARALARKNDVRVFARFEDPYSPNYAVCHTRDEPGDGTSIPLVLVNMAHQRDRFVHEAVDDIFAGQLASFQPDVVHVQHLNHLSVRLPLLAKRAGIPVVYTLHDFWLMCPRGQFVQMFSQDGSGPFPLCDGQDDHKCAVHCYSRYFTGRPDSLPDDEAFFERWVRERTASIREVVGDIDLFLAPARHLMERFERDFSIGRDRLQFLPYGFDHERLRGRLRQPEPDGAFVFGYIGTHNPTKGIHQLIDAFGQLTGNVHLRLWGRRNGESTPALEARCRLLPEAIRNRTEWMGEYDNIKIIPEVFNRCDAIVVPSIWLENSPLVIHEALQARVPVITADAGGMAELIHDGENGLLFRHRDPQSLAGKMAMLAADPKAAMRLGQRGYLGSCNGEIPSIEDHVAELIRIYQQVKGTLSPSCSSYPRPWRITFDTNPDDCNLHCVMCEDHSPYSDTQSKRKSLGLAKRRMGIETIEQVLQELADSPPREIIPSTMGEPLLYAHFERIIELCHRYGTKLNLTTNGTFPRLGVHGWAKLILPVGSDVKISFNGTNKEVQEKVMLGTDLDHILANLAAFAEERDHLAATGGNYCSLTLQATFMEQTLPELPGIVSLAAKLNYDRVKGHHLWAHFSQIHDQDLRRSPDSIRRWNEVAAICREIAAKELRPNGAAVKLVNFGDLEADLGHTVPAESVCPFLGKEAWINHAGRFDPCCAPDDQRRTLGNFGKVTEKGFMNIWNGADYRELVEHYRERPLCQTCLMRQVSVEKG